MCKAIEEMITEGELKGELKGELNGKLKILISLVKDGVLSVYDATVRADMTAEAFEEEMKKSSLAGMN